jgi:hypothetical protein
MENTVFKKNTTTVLTQKEKINKRLDYVQYRINVCEKYLFDEITKDEYGSKKFYAYNQSLENFISEKEFLTDLLKDI